MALLEVKDLCKSFSGQLFEKQKQVLFNVSFKLPEGATSGFVGNNGSGKTTTIKCIFEFIRPDSGQILLKGQKMSSEMKARIGYLPERPYLYEFLTGMEFLRLHWNLCHDGRTGNFIEKAHSALKKVDLFEARDKKLRQYSKGMLQRAGLAQAILNDPELLILDEPMSGLDPDGRLMVKDILREQQKKGVNIFFSSHLLQDMEELCQHLVVINFGKIIYDGSLPQFMAEYSSLEVAFKAAKNREMPQVSKTESEQGARK
jgi:ABC-2 type transport system ATP-binding protein